MHRVSEQRASSQDLSTNVLSDNLLSRSSGTTSLKHRGNPPTFLHEGRQRTHVLLPLRKPCLGLLQHTLLLFSAYSEFFVQRSGYEWCVVGHDRLDIFVFGLLFQILKFELAEERLAGPSSESRLCEWN